MRTLAMILAGGAGSRLSALTQKRTKPAVPFAGKYRIIDFTLSNCVNSGIFTVGICTQYRPRSLNEHIRTGRPWDLNRATGGVTLLQPYMGTRDYNWYRGTADAIYQNLDYVRRQHSDIVLILGGDHVYKMDYDVLTTFHLDHGADLTIATVRVAPEEASRFGILETDEEYRVVGFEEKPARPNGTLGSMGIYVFNADVLDEVLSADHTGTGSRHDFGGDIIPQMIKSHQVYAFPYRGYWVDAGTIAAYWQAHMDLLVEPRLDLVGRDWIIHTRSEERPPVNVRSGAHIEQSLITDGCVIEGTVEHSVLSPGVRVRQGAIVRHSVVMTDAVIEENAVLDHAILDKRVRVGAGAQIGWANDQTSDAPLSLHDKPITVIGKNTRIPAHTRIGRGCTIAADLGEDAFGQDLIPSGTSIGIEN